MWCVRVKLYDGSEIVVPVPDWGVGVQAINATRMQFRGQVMRGEVEFR